MDTDKFVEFVQRTSVKRKTKGSKMMTRSKCLTTAYCSLVPQTLSSFARIGPWGLGHENRLTECDCAISARGL